MFRLFFIIVSLMRANQSLAVPEAVRYGQFSCVSCHVSPGGGGLLTNYGRLFAAEKLSTWAYLGEENLLHGAARPNDFILAGGDARWVDYRTKSAGVSFRKFWRMQTDLELAAHAGPVWLQGMMGTKPAGPNDDPKDSSKLIHRAYSARVDLFDDRLLIRGGLFVPKFGLMHQDHTAFTKVALGLPPDAEQTQAEATVQSDNWEMTVASLFENDMYDRKNKSKSGLNFGLSGLIGKYNRLNLGILQTVKSSATSKSVTTAYGFSGVVSITKKIFSLFEIDRLLQSFDANGVVTTSNGVVSYFTLNGEVFKGFISSLRYEYWNREIALRDMGTRRWGGGLTWYPRPHFQFEFRALRTIVDGSSSTLDESTLILHYYF